MPKPKKNDDSDEDDGGVSTSTEHQDRHQDGHLLRDYKRISNGQILDKVKELKETYVIMQRQWNVEVKEYEKLIRKGRRKFANRNYPNKLGIVQNTKLYPYHTACYPLLDAYDWLEDYKLRSNDIPPSFTSPQDRDDNEYGPDWLDGFLEVSSEAIRSALLYSDETLHRSTVFHHDSIDQIPQIHLDLTKQVWIQHHGNFDTLWNMKHPPNPNYFKDRHKALQLSNLPHHDNSDDDSDDNSDSTASQRTLMYGPHCFPQDPNDRADILLKLLRHALSEIQQDHNLARALIMRLIDWQCFDNTAYFQKFLTILVAEARKCVGSCYDDDDEEDAGDETHDHRCFLYQAFESELEYFVFGMLYFTEEHAYTIAASVKMAVDLVSPAAGEMEDIMVKGEKESKASARVRIAKLKQGLYLWNHNEEDSSDEEDEENFELRKKDPMPYGMLMSFIRGLGMRAQADKFKIMKLETLLKERPNDNSSLNILERLLDSYHNTVRTLVYVAETAVRRFPAKRDSEIVGGLLAGALVGAFLSPDENEPAPIFGWSDKGLHQDYLVVRKKEKKLASLIDYNRYSDAILNATSSHLHRLQLREKRSQHWRLQSTQDGIAEIRWLEQAQPHFDIFFALRSLMSRDILCMKTAGFGFGDIVAWTGLIPTLTDPCMFHHNYNYIIDELDSEDELEAVAWIVDESNRPLSVHETEARHDFSLLKLAREWFRPWRPETHFSFHANFRAAARTLVTCAFRIGLPRDITYHVIEFLPRDWWRDDNARCWCEDCTLEATMVQMRWNLSYGDKGMDLDGNTRAQTSAQYRCPKCRIATYKSKEHCKKDAAAHRKDCCKPPYWIPGKEENALCQLIDVCQRNETTSVECALLTAEAYGHGEDDESWESDGSTNGAKEEADDLTAIMLRWFEEKTYRHQRVEDTGFTSMYHDDE